jgi:hypothetical protein
MFRLPVVLVTLAAFSFTTGGCATLFTGTSDTVLINSEPPGGKVMINGNFMGTAPVSLSLKRSRDYEIMIKKEGYETTSALLNRTFNFVTVLNLGWICCWVLDFVTGAAWRFERDTVTVLLTKETGKTTGLPSPGRVLAGANLVVAPYNGKTAVLMSQSAPH